MIYEKLAVASGDLFRVRVYPPNSTETTFELVATQYNLQKLWPVIMDQFNWTTLEAHPLEYRLDRPADHEEVPIGTSKQFETGWVGRMVVERVKE